MKCLVASRVLEGWRHFHTQFAALLSQNTPTAKKCSVACKVAPPPCFPCCLCISGTRPTAKEVFLCPTGWRRFQSLPVFATEDANGRHRMLKYTPEHMHCLAAVWGPLAPPNTGVIAIQNPSNDQQVRTSTERLHMYCLSMCRA